MYGYHRDLHVLTLSFPTRRSSDLLNPRSDGICAMRDHEAIQSQNASIPCFFSRHSWLALLVSLMKNAESISTDRSEEHTSELQSLMRISYAVLCLNKKMLI